MYPEKKCYTCLRAEHKELVDLYKNDIDNIPYIDKLLACMPKKLHKTASMELCGPCIKQLRISYDFIDMIKGTQEILKLHSEQSEDMKEELCESNENLERRKDTAEVIKNEEAVSVGYNSDSSEYFLANLKNDETSNDVLSCTRCKKDFLSTANFMEHICKATCDDNPIKNEETSESNVTQKIKSKAENTMKKVRNRHSKYNKKQKLEVDCVCDHCDLTFNKHWKLQKHLARVHIQDKKYVCTFCNRGFKQSYHLREHITSHTGERNYSCPICDKTFQRISSQRRHIRSHDAAPGQKTKRTPFLCSTCGKSFPFSNGVQRHMRIHLGIKAHECHICKRRFTQSTHLHVHMRTHTGEKPYICDTCGEAFSLNASLQKHMLMHQNGAKNFVEDFSQMFLVQEAR